MTFNNIFSLSRYRLHKTVTRKSIYFISYLSMRNGQSFEGVNHIATTTTASLLQPLKKHPHLVIDATLTATPITTTNGWNDCMAMTTINGKQNNAIGHQMFETAITTSATTTILTKTTTNIAKNDFRDGSSGNICVKSSDISSNSNISNNDLTSGSVACGGRNNNNIDKNNTGGGVSTTISIGVGTMPFGSELVAVSSCQTSTASTLTSVAGGGNKKLTYKQTVSTAAVTTVNVATQPILLQSSASTKTTPSQTQPQPLPSRQKQRICRDYLQGICRRKCCRYPHVLSAEQVIFCHDFQNTSTCSRTNCKFLHYTVDEEEYYRKYNKFPLRYTEYTANGTQLLPPKPPPPPPLAPSLSNTLPLSILPVGRSCCEMRIHGHSRHRECQYGVTADRRRVMMDCNETKWLQIPPPASYPLGQSRYGGRNYNSNSNNGINVEYGTNGSDDFVSHTPKYSLKRCSGGGIANGNNSIGNDDVGGANNGSGIRTSSTINGCYEPFAKQRFRDDHSDSVVAAATVVTNDIMSILRRFEEEHNMLRRRVEANEVKIAELRASNDFLMSQNAQLRLSNAQQQCSRVVNPVSVTTSQPQATQVINAVSIAPVQVQATPIVSMAAPQTQIIASSSCAPLALTANTSQGQQLALAQQSMSTLSTTNQPLNAAHASQIIGTSQITLTPTLAPAPSMGLTINTSQALAMSNATQPIISYPVMTHSILPH